MLNHKPGSVWQSCVRGGGENPTVFWSGQKHRTQPPLQYGAPVSGPLSSRDCRAPPLGTTGYLQPQLTSTPFTLGYLQEEVRWEDLGIFVCLLTMMRWGLSSVVLLHQDIFISFRAKHLLYSNEKSYWELHVVETEKREVLCKYCKCKDKQGDLPDILAQITKISFWNINTP